MKLQNVYYYPYVFVVISHEEQTQFQDIATNTMKLQNVYYHCIP